MKHAMDQENINLSTVHCHKYNYNGAGIILFSWDFVLVTINTMKLEQTRELIKDDIVELWGGGGSRLDQLIAIRLVGTKPLPEQVLEITPVGTNWNEKPKVFLN